MRIFVSAVLGLFGAVSSVFAEQSYRLEKAVFANRSPAIIAGPERAKGALIWSHGRHNLRVQSTLPPAILVQNLNHRQWDAFVLRRIDGADQEHDLNRELSNAVTLLRARGYRRIVLAGQSAGALGSLRVAGMRDDIDAVIALAPACCGSIMEGGGYLSWFGNAHWIYDAVERLKPTRVFVAFFRDDPFSPEARGPRVARILGRSGMPYWVLDEPDDPALSGHGAGQGYQFANRYGACIARFLDEGREVDCGLAGEGLVTHEFPPAPVILNRTNALAGHWVGIWDSGRAMMLGVDPRPDGTARIHYLLGTGALPSVDRPEHSIWEVEIAPDGSWSHGRFRFEQPAGGQILVIQDMGEGRTRRAILKRLAEEQPLRMGATR